MVLFDPYYVLYYVGFAFVPTERPMAFALTAEGEGGMLVPRLEREHAQANALVDPRRRLSGVPGRGASDRSRFGKLLAEMGVAGAFGADQDGYPWVLGYRGPSLTELVGRTPEKVTAFVEDQMAIKSPAEIELIRESSKWGNLAHVLLQRYTRPGLTEVEVSQRATNEATLAMLDAIGPIYRAQNPFFEGASAGYRGQIGRNAAIPHALTANITFQAGDVLVTGATRAGLGLPLGARAHDGDRRAVDRAAARCSTTWSRCRTPRSRRSSPERAAPTSTAPSVRTTTSTGLWDYWKHHVGHAIGLRYHEGPFLDIGDDTEIKPGMVFTVEPGLYAAGPRWVPSLRHRCGDGGRDRLPDVLPARSRKPDPARHEVVVV